MYNSIYAQYQPVILEPGADYMTHICRSLTEAEKCLRADSKTQSNGFPAFVLLQEKISCTPEYETSS